MYFKKAVLTLHYPVSVVILHTRSTPCLTGNREEEVTIGKCCIHGHISRRGIITKIKDVS